MLQNIRLFCQLEIFHTMKHTLKKGYFYHIAVSFAKIQSIIIAFFPRLFDIYRRIQTHTDCLHCICQFMSRIVLNIPKNTGGIFSLNDILNNVRNCCNTDKKRSLTCQFCQKHFSFQLRISLANFRHFRTDCTECH